MRPFASFYVTWRPLYSSLWHLATLLSIFFETLTTKDASIKYFKEWFSEETKIYLCQRFVLKQARQIEIAVEQSKKTSNVGAGYLRAGDFSISSPYSLKRESTPLARDRVLALRRAA